MLVFETDFLRNSSWQNDKLNFGLRLHLTCTLKSAFLELVFSERKFLKSKENQFLVLSKKFVTILPFSFKRELSHLNKTSYFFFYGKKKFMQKEKLL